MPGLNDQALKDMLTVLEHYTTMYIMSLHITGKDPSFIPKWLKEPNMKAISPFLNGLNKVTANVVNEKVSDIVKKSKAAHDWMVKQAKAAGVPVLEKMPKPKTKRT